MMFNPYSHERMLENRKRLSMLVYRNLQILTNYTNFVIRRWSLYVLSMVICLLISLFYTMFKNNDLFMLPPFLTMTVLIQFITNEILSKCCKLNELSLVCLGEGRHSQGSSKLETAFWVSRTPCVIWIGDLFCIENRDLILKIFGTIVLENVINMLLTFK